MCNVVVYTRHCCIVSGLSLWVNQRLHVEQGQSLMTLKYFLLGISSARTKKLLVIHIQLPQQISTVRPNTTSLKVKWNHVENGTSEQLPLNIHLTYGKEKKPKHICSTGTQDLEKPFCPSLAACSVHCVVFLTKEEASN